VSIRAHLGHFVLAAAVVLLSAPGNFKDVAQGSLVDPDSYMRLVRLREALEQGRWFGYTIAGDASGQGVTTHWSHALDLVILLLRAPLLLVMSPEAALFWAGALLGPVTVGLLGLLCAWAVAPLAPAKWRWFAAFAVAATPPIIGYGQLGGVTHHIALVAAVIGAWGGGGRVVLGRVSGGVLLGFFTALGIWLSPEAMPFSMMAFGAAFLAWLAKPSDAVARALEAAGLAFLGFLTLALAFDPPPSGYSAAELDRLSVTFLWLAAFVCALCWLPRFLGGRALLVRAVALAVGGVVAIALWLALFPGYLGGLTGMMSAEEAQALFPNNAEWQPLDTPALFLTVAGPGTLAVISAFALALVRRGTPAALLWAYAGACAAACVGLAALHIRFAPYQSAIGAMMLPVLLSMVPEGGAGAWRILLRPALLAAFLVLPPIAASFYQPPEVYSAEGADAPESAPRCPMKAAFRLLQPYPGAVVVADLNIGPELLYRTEVKIVGSLYLWNTAGAMRLRAAWRARDLDGVATELRAAGAQYVLACRGTRRSPFVDGPDTTLFDRLNRGDPPGWLRPAAQGEGTGWTLYEVPPLNTPS
jgi:hypothetical protein